MTDSVPDAGEKRSASSAPLASIGVVLAIAGFALLAVEVIRTLTGSVLGGFGTALLWVGVGVLAVGLLLLVLSLASPGEVAEDESTRAWTPPEAPAPAPAPVAQTPPVAPSSNVVEAPPVVETAPVGEPPAPPPPTPSAVAPVEAMPPAASPAPAEQPPSADGS